jgi:glycosyltransferase involved in cell wall biosynthesis
MSVILFYAPFNQRSRDTESLMIAFRRQGHRVISLSQQEGREIHDFLRPYGIETYSFMPRNANSWVRHLRHLAFLIRFCRAHQVDVVYSHLESANFIASVAQFFIRARVYVCRHHADQYGLLGRDRDLSYRVTYGLARHIIAFSEASKNYMIQREGVSADKIIKINLAYDFSLYAQPVPAHVEAIRREVSADIVLITVGSFLPLKRPGQSVEVLKALVDGGHDAALILLGKGELDTELKAMSCELGLENRVFFPGYVHNVLDYIAASTFLLHPSVSESSCVAVKEAGIVSRPVIVCRNIGDFDDYIVDGENGFSVHQDRFVQEAVKLIESTHRENHLSQLGENLKKSVLNLFGVENVVHQYDPLNHVR